MTLLQIRQDILDRIGPGSGLSSSTLNTWINSGQNEFCNAFEFYWLEKSAADTTVASQANYTIPADCRKLLRVYVGSTEYTYVPFSLKENVSTSDAIGAYYTFNASIYLIPTPTVAGTTITFYYYKDPTDMSSDSDTPTIPSRFHEALVYYGLARAYARDENQTQAEYAERKFNEILGLAVKDGQDRQKSPRRRMVSVEEYSSSRQLSNIYNKDWDS
jgi:hypothetical protein